MESGLLLLSLAASPPRGALGPGLRLVGRVSFRLRHEWRVGRCVLGASLSNCPHCGTLRVVLGERTHYLRRVKNEKERVRFDEPPCVAPMDERRARSGERRDKYGCELGPEAWQRAIFEAGDDSEEP